MKKTILIALSIVLVIVIYLAIPIPHVNVKISREENAMNAFISYEQAFYALNQKNFSDQSSAINKQEDDRYQIQDASKVSLLLNFERASFTLNEMLKHLKQEYPFLQNKIHAFRVWQSHAEKQILLGKHLLYWQAPLLTYQLQMMDLLNNKNSSRNWEIEKNLSQQKNIIQRLSVQQKCDIINQFGQTSSPQLLEEQLVILLNYLPQCPHIESKK